MPNCHTHIYDVRNSDKLLSPLLSVTIVSVHCQYFLLALYDLLFDIVCLVDEFCLLDQLTQVSAVINFCMSLNSLEEMCNKLLQVADLVTYTWCHGSAGVLISYSHVHGFLR